ncbi:hypothetical protein SDC9_133839 [bioreactor metagenome]|uniref:Uncharacterized protein n=1 Tax=bioreactor metagenome TaxID=1076179 RepID=A0A645DCJ9_9ZZZZ
MPCGCKKSTVNDKRPDSPCVFCAHKHITTARALYALEIGYRDINKSDAIGQLILAAWHLQSEHFELAMRCRDGWLKIERMQPAAPLLEELQTAAWSLVVEANKTEQEAK